MTSPTSSTRKQDLERQIQETYGLIREYEDILSMSGDPAERQRAQREAERRWQLMDEWLQEYRRLCERLGEPVAEDVRQLIVLRLGGEISEEPTPTIEDTRKPSIPAPDVPSPPPPERIPLPDPVGTAPPRQNGGASAPVSRAGLPLGELVGAVIGFILGIIGNLLAEWILSRRAFAGPGLVGILLLAVAGLIITVGLRRPQLSRWHQAVWILVAGLFIIGSIHLFYALPPLFPPTPSDNRPPVIQEVLVSPEVVRAGAEASLTVIASDPDGDPLAYYWTAQKGFLPSGAQQETVIYRAPPSSGLDTVKVTVTDGRSSVSQEIRISIVP